MTPAKRNLFALAIQLGMTVGELKERLSLSEYLMWVKYYSEPDEDEIPDTTNEELLRAFNVC